MFQKILIANRGEIACRIAKTARRLGVKVAAVYSEADRNALHVQLADEAVFIGPAATSQSYLVIDKIIDAAKQTGAQAIHPGYGFLSENADFARRCQQEGLVFIGPSAETIETMGSKSAAKTLMEQSGVPIVPGYQDTDQATGRLEQEAKRIGYPVLLKASAGGGGKGMRLVENGADFTAALDSAKREALASFGDDRMLIEKFVPRARHVEVQVFGDQSGNIVHLFERDCSIQRRHQKVIEEAPAPNLPAAVRTHLYDAGVKAAQAVDYVGAGTVEFLYDGKDDVYFMEMNTRLQVEHPVTEQITGIDLVEWQLRIAAGEPLPRSQERISIQGHAMEARIYAEDPRNDFLPSTGTLSTLILPHHSTRIDSGVAKNDTVSPHYDPMIAKMTVHGATRDAAVSALAQALDETRIAGVETNTHLLSSIVAIPAFQRGEVSTRFIDDHEAELFNKPDDGFGPYLAAVLWLKAIRNPQGESSPWNELQGWRMNGPAEETHWLTIDNQPVLFKLITDGNGYVANIDRTATAAKRRAGTNLDAPLEIRFSGQCTANQGSLTLNGQTKKFDAAPHKNGLRLWYDGIPFDIAIANPLSPSAQGASAEGSLVAPMPGAIVSLLVTEGKDVAAGETLLVMEAMKMEHAIKAPQKGKVLAFRFQPGDQVKEGDLLVDFKEGS